MKILLDTCVLSEIQKPKGSKNVKETIWRIPDDYLFISVITIGKIMKGIELHPIGKRKNELQLWIQSIETNYAQSILDIDIDTVKIWGTLTVEMRKNGRSLPVCDGLIAATAKRHNLQLMTRNVSDFEHTDINIINPWN